MEHREERRRNALCGGDAITIENTNVTLYAQWKSSTASYRVKYYQQNLKDDNYSIVADRYIDTLWYCRRYCHC